MCVCVCVFVSGDLNGEGIRVCVCVSGDLNGEGIYERESVCVCV